MDILFLSIWSYDGELNDINGDHLSKYLDEYEIDRNIQAITGGLFVIPIHKKYSLADGHFLNLSNLYLT